MFFKLFVSLCSFGALASFHLPPAPSQHSLKASGALATLHGGVKAYAGHAIPKKLNTVNPETFAKQVALFKKSINTQALNLKPLDAVVQIPSPFFGAEYGLARILLQPGPARVAVYMPTMFSCLLSPLVSEGMERLAAAGYTVIAPASPWCHQVRSLNPIADTGHVDLEAQGALGLIQRALDLIPASMGWNAEQHPVLSAVYGESYGALLGAAVLAQQGLPLETGARVLLVSPPLHLGQSAAVLDVEMDRLMPLHRSGVCSKVSWELSGALLAITMPQFFSRMGAECVDVAAYMINFYDDLVALAAQKDGKDPKLNKEDYRDLRFHSYVEHYAPGSLPVLNGDATGGLVYWLNRIDPALRLRTQVLSAQDDIINSSNAWTTGLLGALVNPTPNVHVYPTGGHMGFVATVEFNRYFKLFFKP